MRFLANLTSTIGLLLLGIMSALADPNPTAVIGEFVDGAQITIQGNQFGSKAQASPIFFDTQDKVWINGSMSRPYTDLPDGEPVPVGADQPWLRGSSGDPVIRRQGGYPRYLGSFSTSPSSAWLEYPAGFPNPTADALDEVYIRWWWKSSFDPHDTSYSPDGSGTSAKFIRIWDSTGSSQKDLRISWTQMHATGAGAAPSWSNWNGPGVIGQWNLFEVFLNTASGTFQASINGELVHNISGYNFGDPDGIQPRLWGLNGSGTRNWSGETVEFSDYYADSTRARVEIGDAPNWAAVTIREPQVPLSWSSSEIRVELHRGLLDKFDGKYLYVIDTTGSVNSNGLPIGDAPRPKPPQMSSTQ